MIDLYEQIGLQRFLSASFDMADEVLLAPVARGDPDPVASSAPNRQAGSTNLRGLLD
jgi:hypothetical protein